jgi:hypothetical protein
MSLTNLSKATETGGGAVRGRRSRRARAGYGCVLAAATMAATMAAVACVSGVANAATTPAAQLSFSPATISTGSQPDMTFMSQNVPSGALLYLQESSDGGQHWKTVDKTTSTQGTAEIAALPEDVYWFRILIADDGTELATSAPATLTVTGSNGATPTLTPVSAPVSAPAQAPATAAPAPAPSGSGISWLEIIVKPVWDAIVATVIGWIFSLF